MRCGYPQDGQLAGMTSRKFRALAALGLVTLPLTACARSSSPPGIWNVTFSHVYATNTDYQKMAERFRDLMHDRTGGRFRVLIYPSGQLGDERVTFEQLQFGAQQMAISGTPVLSGWVPEGQIFDLPYLFRTPDQGVGALNGRLGDWWKRLLLEKTGVRALGFLEYGFRHVYNRKRRIEVADDLAGLKLRVLQNTTYLQTYNAFRVQATPMAYGEVYSALQQGVIDGGEANAIGYLTDRFYEVAPYFSFTSITYNPITLLINDAFYRSLPSDVRDSVVRSAHDALTYQTEVSREMTRAAIEEMEKVGVTISRPSLDSFERVARPAVWNELARRLHNGQQLIEWVQRETGALQTSLQKNHEEPWQWAWRRPAK
jgi:tripartite ATP-independent transporter DctP family solute receptor